MGMYNGFNFIIDRYSGGKIDSEYIIGVVKNQRVISVVINCRVSLINIWKEDSKRPSATEKRNNWIKGKITNKIDDIFSDSLNITKLTNTTIYPIKCNKNLADIVANTGVFKSIFILPIKSDFSDTAVIEANKESEKANQGQKPIAR